MLSKFESLRDEWNALLETSQAYTIFLSWEWLFTWWKIFGTPNKLFLLTVREDSELVGIAPLYLETAKFAYSFSYRQLGFLGSHHVGSDYLDFIISPHNTATVTRAILDYLEQNRKQWDILKLTDILESSCTLHTLREYWQNKFHFSSRVSQTCPYVELPSTWEDFLQSIGARTRKNIRQAKRRFEKNGYRFEVVEQRDEVAHAIDEIVDLHQGRAQSKKIVSPFGEEKFCEFHRSVIPLLAERDSAKFYFIRQNGKTLAGKYLYSDGRKRYGYITAINDEFARLSPGVSLLAHCIEDAIAAGIDEFDFLRGRETWKTHWTSRQRQTATLEVYNGTFLMMLRYWFSKSRAAAKSLVRKYVRPKN